MANCHNSVPFRYDVGHVPTIHSPTEGEMRVERKGNSATSPAPTLKMRTRAPERHPQRARAYVPVLKRFITILAALLLLALAGWGTLKLSDPHTLPLKSVRIEGEFMHVTLEELQRAIAPVTSGGFFTANLNAISRAARTLPWVRGADVRRVWPDTLYVTFGEQTAVARWGEEGLLNDEGQIFRPDPKSYPPGLPRLRGPENTESALLVQYRAMGQVLAPLHLQIVDLESDQRGAKRLTLNNGIEVLLGHADIEARLARFARAYPLLVASPPSIERIDLRYGNGFAVRARALFALDDTGYAEAPRAPTKPTKFASVAKNAQGE